MLPEQLFDERRARVMLVILTAVFYILSALPFIAFRVYKGYYGGLVEVLLRGSLGSATMIYINMFIIRRYLLGKMKWNLVKNVLWYLWNGISMGIFRALVDFIFSSQLPNMDYYFSDRIKHSLAIFILPYATTYIYMMISDMITQANNSLRTVSTNSSKVRITLKGKNKTEIISIDYRYLLYIQGFGNYVVVFYKDSENMLRKHMIRVTMKSILNQLKDVGVSKVHRSYIVNDSAIEKFIRKKGKIFIVLNFKQIELPVSPEYFRMYQKEKQSI